MVLSSSILLILNYILSVYLLKFIIDHIQNSGIDIITLKAEESIAVIFYIMSVNLILFLIPVLYIIFYYRYFDALYSKEKKLFLKIPLFYLFCILGFFLGFILGLLYLIPLMIQYNSVLNLRNTITLTNLINILLINSLVFAFIFILPIIIKYLIKFNIIEKHKLEKNRKIIFFICLVLGGILSPTELMSMFIITIPLYLAFELGLKI